MLLIHIENASLQRGYCPACTSGVSNKKKKKKQPGKQQQIATLADYWLPD